MKHIPQDNFAEQGVTATEYKLALYAELKRDREANTGDPAIPVRILSIIDRAFVRANAGEFQ